MEFLKSFKSDSDFFSDATNLPLKNVSYTRLEGNVWFDIQRKIHKTNCLTFTAVSGGSGPGPSPGPEVAKSGLSKSSSDTSYITIYTSGSTSKNIEYSFDNGASWKKLNLSSSGGGGVLRGGSVGADGTITLKKGESVSFRGVNDNLCGQNQEFQFSTSGTFKVSGDVTSLLNGVGGDVDLTDRPYCFSGLFKNCDIITPPRLPSTKLSVGCYDEMFRYCGSLTTAPQLPATTLASNCYANMFQGCSSLTTAPNLPATTLADYCYNYMFYNCTSMTTVQQTLPATALADYCYAYMFSGCSALTTAPNLSATTLSPYCYRYMFQNCTSLTTVQQRLPATTLVNSCYQGMFYGCSALTTAPELPAQTLVQYCYDFMFTNCSNLSWLKALFLTKPSTTYTRDWMLNVRYSGTFVKHTNATWTITAVYGVPGGWYVERASA